MSVSICTASIAVTMIRPENIHDIEQKGVLLKPAEGEDRSIETNYDFAACTVSKDKISINGTEISVMGGIALASRQCSS